MVFCVFEFYIWKQLKDHDCMSFPTNVTYFIARTLAILFVIAIRAILGTVADGQLWNATA